MKKKVILLAGATLLIYSSAYGAYNTDCMSCHGKKDFYSQFPHVDKKGMYIAPDKITGSAHTGISCIQCHTEIKGYPHKNPTAKVNCARCHKPQAESFFKSIHSKVSNGPDCVTCHGSHDIKGKPYLESTAGKKAMINICANCHKEQPVDEETTKSGYEWVNSYKESVHGVAFLKKGISVAAVCTDCHGSHDIEPSTDQNSKINKLNIPVTCSKCHEPIYAKYVQSIHWHAVKDKHIMAAPVCTDCHGEHKILKPTNPKSSVYAKNIPTTCSKCHSSVTMAKKYDLPLGRLSTYENSFHGIALKFGNLEAANCASCHGTHEILPSSDPRSSINKANLVKTCGRCHPNASADFVKGKIHVIVNKHGEKGPYYVRIFYTWFIGILITIFVVYVIFDLINIRRKKIIRRKHE